LTSSVTCFTVTRIFTLVVVFTFRWSVFFACAKAVLITYLQTGITRYTQLKTIILTDEPVWTGIIAKAQIKTPTNHIVCYFICTFRDICEAKRNKGSNSNIVILSIYSVPINALPTRFHSFETVNHIVRTSQGTCFIIWCPRIA
jgi:hypothetical protein